MSKTVEIILTIVLPIIVYILYDVLFGIINPIKPEIYGLVWTIVGIVPEVLLIIDITKKGTLNVYFTDYE